MFYTAQPICPKNYPYEYNCSIAYVTSFNVAGNVSLTVACAYSYRVFVNGKFVGFGPSFTAHGYVKTDKHNITKHSNEGSYIVVIETSDYNIGTEGMPYCKPFLLAEVVSNGQILAYTGDIRSFNAYYLHDKISRTKRLPEGRTFVESYDMRVSRANLYAGIVSGYKRVDTMLAEWPRLMPRTTTSPNYAKKNYKRIIEGGSAELDKQQLPEPAAAVQKPFEYAPKDVVSRPDEEAANIRYTRFKPTADLADQYNIYDFNQVITAFFNLRLSVRSQSDIYIVYSETAVEKWDDSRGALPRILPGNLNVLKFSLAPGQYKLTSFEPYTFRYAKLIILGDAYQIDLRAFLYENRDIHKFDYNTADDRLGKLIAAAVNTCAQNTVDFLTYSASDRRGMLMSSGFISDAERLFSGALKSTKAFLENIARAPNFPQLPKGMIPACYPSEPDDYSPDLALFYIKEIFDYYQRTGDKTLVRRARKKIYALLKFFKKKENKSGLLEDTGGKVYFDGDIQYLSDGVNYPLNMLYCYCQYLASLTYGDPELAERSTRLRDEIIEQAFDGDYFADRALRIKRKLCVQPERSEACQYFAFYFGLATPNTHPVLYKKLLTEYGHLNNPGRTGELRCIDSLPAFLLRQEILLRYGEAEAVFNECTGLFKNKYPETKTLFYNPNGDKCIGMAAHAAVLALKAATGFVEFSQSDNTIFMTNVRMKTAIDVTFKTKDGPITILATENEVKISVNKKLFRVVYLD